MQVVEGFQQLDFLLLFFYVCCLLLVRVVTWDRRGGWLEVGKLF